jgi:hypothetical protein
MSKWLGGKTVALRARLQSLRENDQDEVESRRARPEVVEGDD